MGIFIDDATTARLLGSIEAQNLVAICGAGLSIPAPSRLLSAIAVSRRCFDRQSLITPLAPELRDDVEALAEHFRANGQFESLFINTLVPWDDLVGDPNDGHAAVGDLLVTGGLQGALSANFDTLIERWCESGKVPVRGALDGVEATQFRSVSAPLVKFHGCMTRGREKTLWTTGQMVDQEIQRRVTSCSQWMGLNLPNRDLLVVGFWSDWGYLNDVLANALTNATGFVVVIDPSPTEQLRQKAPALWARLTASPLFTHIQASGDDALKELRTAFSQTWIRRLMHLGRPLYEAMRGAHPNAHYDAPDEPLEVLYAMRRDCEGSPMNVAARSLAPTPDLAQAGLAHRLLADRTNARDSSWYVVDGQTVRVVQGAGRGIQEVKAKFKEPPAAPTADVVVCAGAVDPGVPPRIISAGAGKSVVRPAQGGTSRWMTLGEAQQDLRL